MAKNKRVTIPGIAFVQERDGIAEYRLEKNGLRILLAPDPAQPVVGVMVTYLVGSRNEGTGYTGATHLLEHLMFKGSRKFNKKNGNRIRDVLDEKGAIVNATTYYDRTNYFEIMQPEYLSTALEIEADRMRYAFIDEKDRASEMTVVRNEFEGYEDSPFIVLDRLIFGLAFQSHPYHNPPIGWREDIENVPIERLQRFYNDFYWPDNAVLTIAGGFEASDALKRVKKHFSEHARKKGAYPSMYAKEPLQEGPRRGVVRRPASNALGIAFKMPAADHADIPALTVLGYLLTEGKTSRLNQALVENGYATNEFGYWLNLKDPGLFQLFATLTEGKTHQEVEALILQEIENVQKKAPSARELEKVRVSLRTTLAHRRDGVYAFLESINEDIAAGDWTRFVTLPDRFQAVTAADVQRVARTYLVRDQSTTGWFIRTD